MSIHARQPPLRVVLHVITGLGSGGAERMLTRLVTRKQEGTLRHVVVSLLDEGIHGAAMRTAGVELHCLHMKSVRGTVGALFRLTRLIRACRPSLIMTWLYHADLLGTIATTLSNAPALIWNLRCSDMEFRRYSRAMRWMVKVLSRLSGLPRAIVANSNAGIEAHKRLGYKPAEWLHLPNGFDLAEWRPIEADREKVRGELGIHTGEVLIGMIARTDPKKDHTLFLQAALGVATRFSSARFILIGEGTDKLIVPQALRERFRCLGERQDIARLLRGLDGMVLCSAYGEGFPNVVGEAMATAVPCIVTDVGDTAAIVGNCGWVVPPRDGDALRAAMEELVAVGPEKRRALASLGRNRIEENWSIDRIAAAYQALWDRFA